MMSYKCWRCQTCKSFDDFAADEGMAAQRIKDEDNGSKWWIKLTLNCFEIKIK